MPPQPSHCPDPALRKYDDSASVYRRLWAPHLRRAGLRLLEEVSPAGVERVLEVGCGVGALLPDLSRAFPSATVFGSDLSRGMLEQIPGEQPRVRMDARHLALADASVDAVVQNFMLFHLDSPLDGLRETRRVLRLGGRAGAATWARDEDSGAEAVLLGCLDEFGAEDPDPEAHARHRQVDSPGKLQELYHAAGFARVHAWTEALRYRLTVDEFVELRSHLGRTRPRLDALSETDRAACLEEVRRRLASLPPEEVTSRRSVVFCTAEAA